LLIWFFFSALELENSWLFTTFWSFWIFGSLLDDDKLQDVYAFLHLACAQHIRRDSISIAKSEIFESSWNMKNEKWLNPI
jgi:hypothetical protein